MGETPEAVERGLGPDPESVRELAVLRGGGLRAMVTAVPALRHLRSVYPLARITVGVQMPAGAVLANCPYIDRLVDLARPSELLIEPFDVGLLLESPREDRGGVEQLFRRIDAESRVGYRVDGRPSEYLVHPTCSPRLGETARMLHLAWLLGGDTPDSSFALWPTLADRSRAAALVGSIEAPIALVDARDDGKVGWSSDVVQRSVGILASAGMQPVFIGAEPPAVASDDSLDLRGRTDVSELVALMERAALFVGPYGGAGAVALAVGADAVIVGGGAKAWFDTVPRNVRVIETEADGAGDADREIVLAELTSAADRAVRSWKAAAVPGT